MEFKFIYFRFEYLYKLQDDIKTSDSWINRYILLQQDICYTSNCSLDDILYAMLRRDMQLNIVGI